MKELSRKGLSPYCCMTIYLQNCCWAWKHEWIYHFPGFVDWLITFCSNVSKLVFVILDNIQYTMYLIIKTFIFCISKDIRLVQHLCKCNNVEYNDYMHHILGILLHNERQGLWKRFWNWLQRGLQVVLLPTLLFKLWQFGQKICQNFEWEMFKMTFLIWPAQGF